MKISDKLHKIGFTFGFIALWSILNFASWVPEHVSNFPFREDFENQKSNYIDMQSNCFSTISLDNKAANIGKYGLLFGGFNKINNEWKDSLHYNSNSNLWETNNKFISTATIKINASQNSNLELTFGLKQTYFEDRNNSWFRVLLNGKPIADVNGIFCFHPDSRKNDAFETKKYDLSAFSDKTLSLTFQSCCRYTDLKGGDCAFVDNISVCSKTKMKIVNISSDDNDQQNIPDMNMTKIKITTSGFLEPICLENFVFKIKDLKNGNKDKNINVVLFSTGSNNNLKNKTVIYSAANIHPVNNTINLTFDRPLREGKNYFWLCIDGKCDNESMNNLKVNLCQVNYLGDDLGKGPESICNNVIDE
jgi:hypothetical protein